MTRLLLVDDDLIMRTMLGMLFSDSNYKVYQASNGKEALKILQHTPIDIVIAEMVLPETDGFELLMELRKRPSPPKFIAITGGGQLAIEDYLRVAAQLGAHHTLAKPFRSEELVAAIDQVRAADKEKQPPAP